MKSLVLYYSQKGSNRYLAERIAKELHCDIEAIQPRIDLPPLMIKGLHLGNKKMHHTLANYDRIILCGTIWTGQFIAPLRCFVKQQLASIKRLVFVTCCGSSYEKKTKSSGTGWSSPKSGKCWGKNVRCAKPFPLFWPCLPTNRGTAN